MPIQERESFGETRCKSEANIKTVINKWLDFTHKEHVECICR